LKQSSSERKGASGSNPKSGLTRPLSVYEIERLRNIERNKQLLRAAEEMTAARLGQPPPPPLLNYPRPKKAHKPLGALPFAERRRGRSANPKFTS
jgi:hypothetical protein